MRDHIEGKPLRGGLAVVVGPMFSGKSEELIRRLRRAIIAGLHVQTFKPDLDTRSLCLLTHTQSEFPAQSIPADKPGNILELLRPDTEVVAVDEVQFFTAGIVPVVETLAGRGIRVILAGLDQDYRGQPFGPVPHLLAIADEVEKLSAICTICGEPATKSQRLDPQTTGTVAIGAADRYAARCRAHHVVPPEDPVQTTPPSA